VIRFEKGFDVGKKGQQNRGTQSKKWGKEKKNGGGGGKGQELVADVAIR